MGTDRLAATASVILVAGCYVDMQAVEDELAKRYTILCKPVVPTKPPQDIVVLTDSNGEQIGASGLSRAQLDSLEKMDRYRFVLRKKFLGFTKTWPMYDWVVVEVYKHGDALYVEEPSNPSVQTGAASRSDGREDGQE